MNKIFVYALTVIMLLQIFSMGFLLVPADGPTAGIETSKTNDDFISDQIIIKFNDEIKQESRNLIHKTVESTILQKNNKFNLELIQIPKGKTSSEMIQFYQSLDTVAYAERNYVVHACMIPNDEQYENQWHLHNHSQGGIDIEPAWDVSTGDGVVIAVIDTGITPGTDLAETCFIEGYDFANNDTDPFDDQGHGTHVAGTIAQSTNNTIGVCGIAYNACLMPIKVLDNTGHGTIFNLVNGIYYAVNHSANIISLSLGGPSSNTLQNAVAYAYEQGVTIIAAAGNDNGTIVYPAAYDQYVIAVGATQFDKTKAPYSNYGMGLDLVAPGGNINLDQNNDGNPDGIYQQTCNESGWGYHFFQGTSMAAPHVSGVAALIYALGITEPDIIRSIMESTAIDLGESGWDSFFGHGLLNANKALNLASCNQEPIANFTYTKNGLTIFFNDLSTDQDENLVNWTWDFGDGNISFAQHPTHTYAQDGIYQIELTVRDSLCLSNQTIQVISVENILPQVTFTRNPAHAKTLDTIFFLDLSTDLDGTLVQWNWDFDDGFYSTQQHPSHQYLDDGIYVVNLTVTDNDDGVNWTTRQVTILNRAPNPDFMVTSLPVSTADTINFTDESTDTDGMIMNWSWEFGDGNRSFAQHPIHQYVNNGLYKITLLITDDDNASNSTTKQIMIENEKPISDFTYTPLQSSTLDEIEFMDQSFDTDGTILNWSWDFGDGNRSFMQHPTHQYVDDGSYNVTLIVTDDDNATQNKSDFVFISNQVPSSNFSFTPPQLSTADEINFYDLSMDADGIIITWFWEFGDGNSSPAQHPVHCYSDDGCYEVSLTVWDDDNGCNISTTSINVSNVDPISDFIYSPSQPSTIDQIQFTDQSFDTDGMIMNWSWDFGDGNGSIMQHPTHQYVDDGSYTVTLIVTDDDDANETIIEQINIQNQKPIPQWSISPEEPITTKPVQFTDCSYDIDGTIINWSWDFDDGNGSFAQHPKHQFRNNRTYRISLTITDDDDAVSTIVFNQSIKKGYTLLVQPGDKNIIDELLADTNVVLEINVTEPINVSIYPISLNETSEQNTQHLTLLKPLVNIDVEKPLSVIWPIEIRFYFSNETLFEANLTKEQLLDLYFFDENTSLWEPFMITGVNHTDDQRGYIGYLWAKINHLTLISGMGDAQPPDKVENVTVEDKQDETLHLSWDESNDNEAVSSYKIYRDNMTNCIATVPHLTTAYIDAEVNCDQIYTYWISAVDSSNNTGCPSEPKTGIPTKKKQSQTTSSENSGGGYFSPNKRPVALILINKTVAFSGQPIFFDGSISSDPDGILLNWSWDFGDSSMGYEKNMTHIYMGPGIYQVILSVTDDKGSIDDCCINISITQPNRAPSPAMILTPFESDSEDELQGCISFYSIDEDHDQIRYLIDWGDGTTSKTTYLEENTSVTMNHTWEHAQQYTVSICGTDEHNASSKLTTYTVSINTEVVYVDELISGFLIDIGDDDHYDYFYNNETNRKTKIEAVGESVKIDTDNDGNWDYLFHPIYGVRVYGKDIDGKNGVFGIEEMNFFTEIILYFSFLFAFIFLIYFFRKKIFHIFFNR